MSMKIKFKTTCQTTPLTGSDKRLLSFHSQTEMPTKLNFELHVMAKVTISSMRIYEVGMKINQWKLFPLITAIHKLKFLCSKIHRYGLRFSKNNHPLTFTFRYPDTYSYQAGYEHGRERRNRPANTEMTVKFSQDWILRTFCWFDIETFLIHFRLFAHALAEQWACDRHQTVLKYISRGENE